MKITPEKIHQHSDVYSVYSHTLKQLNSDMFKRFLALYLQDDVKRTHLFNGRYENIYLNKQHIPVLSVFESKGCEYAYQILGTDNVKMGYWFNYMPPGSVTTAHNHDDDKELLSAVYYISTPENSGDIIIQTQDDNIRISPEEGRFIFFKPDMVHEVTENKSSEARLSIGINFGK